jgi:hypothetical protein
MIATPSPNIAPRVPSKVAIVLALTPVILIDDFFAIIIS